MNESALRELSSQVIQNHKIFFTCSLFGSGGAAFFHSLLDNHPQLYTIPFDIHRIPITYRSFETLSRQEHLALLLENNDRFFNPSEDTNKNNTLNKLGENRNETVKIDRLEFKNYLETILDTTPFNCRNFYLAVMLAYNLARGRLPESNTFVTNAHDFPQAYRLRKEMGDVGIIAMARHPLNLYKSFCRRKFNERLDDERKQKNDNFLEYYQPSNTPFLKQFQELFAEPGEKLGVVHIEELHANPEESMRGVAEYMGIRFEPTLLQSTFGGLKWWGSHYTRLYGFSRDLHRIVDRRSTGVNDAFAIFKATAKLQRHLGYSRRGELSFWENIRSGLPGIRYYADRTKLLKKTLTRKKGVRLKLDCFLHWCKDILFFSLIRIRHEKKAIETLMMLDSNHDYTYLEIINPLSQDSLEIEKGL